MICVSIQGRNLAGIRQALAAGLEMAEIRLDRCPLSLEEIETLFSETDIPLVATCRVAECGGEETSLQRLEAAIRGGARYVDLEIEASAALAEKIGSLAEEAGARYIRSFHDFEGTPSAEELKDIMERCFDEGADLAKIVTTATDEACCDRVMELYESATPGSLLAFCMGEAGRATRLGCLVKGAPYTYCALTEEEAAAPGQWAWKDMAEAVYAGRTFPGHRTPQEASHGRETSPFSGRTRQETSHGREISPFSGRTRQETSHGREISPFSGRTPQEASHGREISPFSGRTRQEASHGREISPFSGHGSCGVASASRTIAIPCSKSYAQRAILAAALADGVSHLEGYSPCGDNESAIALVQSLGASVERDGSSLTVKGIAARPGTLAVDSVHVGESGFLTRMTVPLMAVLNGKALTVTGEKTLVGRPLKGAAQAMAAFGSQLRNAEPGADAPLTVPLTIESPLAPGEATVSGRDGSQIISGLMAALPLLDKDSIIHVKDPRSVPYLLVTLDVLNSFGIEVDSITADGDIDFEMKGSQRYHAADFRIEGDWSSAANFLVAGAIFGSADVSGLELGSLQADSAILEILAEAGAIVYQTEEGTVHVQKSPLTAFETDANDCPDIFPIVALLAAFSEGVSAINGTGRLAGKESDRAAAILTMLQQMGVKAAIERDTMYIEGHSLSSRLLSGSLLKGGSYTSGHDHRMVMALMVASLGADGPVEIDDSQCVEKSFPTFPDLFEKYTSKI